MPAAMPVGPRLHRCFFEHVRLLAQPRQGVKLAQKGNHRPAFTCLSHDRRGDPGDLFMHLKALIGQFFHMRGHRGAFGIAGLRRCPDPVAQGLETALSLFDI